MSRCDQETIAQLKYNNNWSSDYYNLFLFFFTFSLLSLFSIDHGSYKNGIQMQKILRGNQRRYQFLQGILAPEKLKSFFSAGSFERIINFVFLTLKNLSKKFDII